MATRAQESHRNPQSTESGSPTLRLADIIDISQFQMLQDRLNEIYSFPSAIIDNDGKILTATAWQDICTKFHRSHPECEKECIASDQYILGHLHEANPAVSYRCPHGLVDNATPIIIEGVHYGNFFTGQFFLEPPDLEFFRQQAARFGFPEREYLDAVRKVPIWTQQQLENYLYFIKGMIEVIASVGLKQLREMETARILRESNQFNQQIINGAQDGIIVYDTDMRYKMWNPKMEEFANVPQEDILGKLPLEAFPFLQEVGVYEQLQQALRGESTSQVVFFHRNRRSGGGKWFSDTTAPLRDADGAIIGAIGIVRDVTDLREAEEARRRAIEQEKMAIIGRLAGKMAHDFNNILGIIMGTGELLLTRDLSPETKSAINIIVESTVRGRELTRNLLVFSKDQEPKLSRFDVNEKIDMIVKALRTDLLDIEVNLTYGPSLDKLLADAGLIENALINIIQNSIHAVSKTAQPQLWIKTSSEKNVIRIEIRDNGCGIPPEWIDKIYDPTVSLKGSGDRLGAYRSDIKGSGYGMANVKRCIDKHGGTISVESNIGRGTNVTITLPLTRETLSEEEIASIPREIVRGKSVLIVEDEGQLGRVLYSVLEKFHKNISLATDGTMALSYLANHTYDVISLDFLLPDLNGMEVYKKIRERNKDVPIIFVSGNFEFMQSMIDLKKNDPRVDHLAKPFSNAEYVRKINDWLSA